MKILIDRDELVRVFKSRRAFYCDEKPESFRKLDYSDKCRVDMLDSCIADVFNMPKQEAFYNKNSLSEALENQETGHWVVYSELTGEWEGTKKYACHNCGAKMEGE